ncbi:Zinc finger protein containing five transmembrane domains [Maublancomyces gigas]|uniref:Zinc finger protein containing five transmembrane domains n=1 Tax=Discina gigas TaxID=1032678 RepID=A0ABR3GP51_9PEZI
MSVYTLDGEPSAAKIAWTRGVALIIGIVSAVVVNWVIWPFVARHELRKSLSFMMLNLGVSYRGVVARYIYYDADSQPTKEDLERSEMQEARLREGTFLVDRSSLIRWAIDSPTYALDRGFANSDICLSGFVRMHELLEMTRHEIRIRGPFDSGPYNAAIHSCERFLEHIVEVRQSSLFFQPFLFGGTKEFTRKMISVRRDAAASILMNLYILAGALRAKRPVPTYLPSAAAARKRLLDRMAEIEEENEALAEVRPRPEKTRRWADVYQYAYSSALTDIVEELEQLQRFTKAITGEMALDFPDW